MLASVPLSISDARQYGVVGKIERTWRVKQVQRGVLSLDTINNLIRDWKKGKINLIMETKDLTVIRRSVIV